ncbi:nitronate monooxygenase, partial [Pseudomonas sp. MWU13-2625]
SARRKSSPITAIGDSIRPNCEAYGDLLDAKGSCSYIDAYHKAKQEAEPGAKRAPVWEKTCLCTHRRNFDCWTCSHYPYRLKDTSHSTADGSYQLLTAKPLFQAYQYSKDHKIAMPPRAVCLIEG